MNSQTWLDSLPLTLATHRAILIRLLEAIAGEPAYRWLEIACSLAAGRADQLSDLDLGLGVADDRWPAALKAIPALLREVAPVVDLLEHQIPEWGDVPHRRFFVQYANGVQIDLVAIPASQRNVAPPGSVILYDPDGRLMQSAAPSIYRADAQSVHEWAFLGWTALADLDKYLRRGSLWEALERLHLARTYICRLWAAAQDVPYPVFGLTSLLDSPDTPLPPGLEQTVATLDAADLRRAVLVAADLLTLSSVRAASAIGGTPPTALAAYVRNRLTEP